MVSLVFASIRISLLAAPGPGMEVNWFCSFLGLHDGGIVGGHNMLRRHEEFENGTAWSNSSESSDDSSSPRLSAVGLRGSARHKSVVVTPDIQPAASGRSSSQPDVSFRSSAPPNPAPRVGPLREAADSSGDQTQSNGEEEKGPAPVMTGPDGEDRDAAATTTDGHSSRGYSRSLSHISENSADGAAPTDRPAESGEAAPLASGGLSVSDVEMELPSGTPGTTPRRADPSGSGADARPESVDLTYVARRVSVEEEEEEGGAGADCLPQEGGGPVDSGLEDALVAVISSLDDYRGQFPELQLLEQELRLLQVTLKGGRRSRTASVASLAVETALGSFDFLNASDWEEEEEKGKKSGSGRSLQEGGWDSPPSPLTTGCTTLDGCLVVHLKNCSTQLLRLGVFGPLRCREMYALDRLLREARVLEAVRRVAADEPRRRRASEVVPQLGLCLGSVSLWQRCVGQGSVYSVSAESFLDALSTTYSGVLPERAGNMADTVFLTLVERVLDQRLPRRDGSRDAATVTLFQWWSYLEANSVAEMETLVTELAEEVWLARSLASRDQDAIVRALRRPAERGLQGEGLHAVAKLLKDPRGKVSASASSALRSLAARPRPREQALVGCLELLEDEDVDARVCGCKALACLKAKESIDQLVYLCRTDKDEVREAAKQALLVLGEEGKMAYRHVETSQDSVPRLFAPGSMASTAF